jgi:polyisoprenoid-binding protein YceI
MKTRALIAAIALIALASIAGAAPVTWKVDPKHTEVGFEVRHFFSKVHGRFREFEGTIVFDEADPAAISVDATVNAASVDTGNPNRDADLKTDHFFLVEKYPTLTFKSTKVTKSGKNAYKVTGDLTMRGVTKSVTFDAEFLGSSPVGVEGQSWGSRAGFEASTVVNRKDFGINWNQKLDNGGWMVDDMVKIVLSVEGSAEGK